ncbi:S-adenosyl-L-methionine-dependent methyltransferase [Geranomyces variabilis]|nr:S-adenosyl-L-methionine-dependent methyltransferase [Geranomyces variabilis]KAJ3137691.1 hypothetical protein HDU90_001641 [Geranomyces variabilis]
MAEDTAPETQDASAELVAYIGTLTPETDSTSTIRSLLAAGADVHARHELGATVLHLAAAKGNQQAVTEILRAGAQWNAIDDASKSVGEYARENGHEELYAFLVDEGVRTEFLLMALGASSTDAYEEEEDVEADEAEAPELVQDAADVKLASATPAAGQASAHPSNADYLSRPLTFSEGRILDADKNGVMMGWEEPLMERHAAVIAPTPGLSVLNVGFGLGLIDKALQRLKPAKHTIIEAHPDVYAQMLREGWDKKPGVRILFGRWQDVLGDLEAYDGIFFDTFGEYYDDLKAFHEHLPNILNQDGIYSFFNGLAGTNPFFHDVACGLAEADLREMGLETKYIELVVDELGDETWRGVRRPYYSLPIYRLPVCKFEEF